MKRWWLIPILSISLLAALPFSPNAGDLMQPNDSIPSTESSQEEDALEEGQTNTESKGGENRWTPENFIALIIALFGSGGIWKIWEIQQQAKKEFESKITQKDTQIEKLKSQLSNKIEAKDLFKEINGIISTEEFRKNLIDEIAQNPNTKDALIKLLGVTENCNLERQFKICKSEFNKRLRDEFEDPRITGFLKYNGNFITQEEFKEGKIILNKEGRQQLFEALINALTSDDVDSISRRRLKNILKDQTPDLKDKSTEEQQKDIGDIARAIRHLQAHETAQINNSRQGGN